MSRITLILIAVVVGMGLLAAAYKIHSDIPVASTGSATPGVPDDSAPPTGSATAAVRLSGPFTHDNLTIFLIHGEDQLKNRSFLTLEEALEQKKAVVHETGSVNQLSIENVSTDAEVFIASGDIVKGGQQDRVLAHDMLLPPQSGKQPVNAFCVEHGRWHGRGTEAAGSFGSSKEQLASKNLKLAARYSGEQAAVWKEVANVQDSLAVNLNVFVKDERSASSLQLTLENKKLQEATQAYLTKLQPLPNDQSDVIGFAFAINGKIYSTDSYACSSLFKKLWPKLLKASAVEAVAELKKDKTFPAVTPSQIQTFLADANNGKVKEKQISKDLQEVQKASDRNVLFETLDQRNKNVRLRSCASCW